jgi:endonuclease G
VPQGFCILVQRRRTGEDMLAMEKIRQRQLERAAGAGSRWNATKEIRAETVRLLKVGGPELADTPERVARYRAREEAKQLTYARAGVTTAYFAERRIGPTLDLDESPPNEAARLAGVPVGRLVQLGPTGTVAEGFATGFLIASNLILTNNHVFAAASECENCAIQFGYEKVNGLLSEGTLFPLDPRVLFYTNPQLDFTVVGVSWAALVTGTLLAQFRSLPLIPTTGKILVGQPISIIQYPDAGPKKYGVRDNELLIPPQDNDPYLEYTTDTLPGSSGSPAFNRDWEVVALHHSGVPEVKDGSIMTIRGDPWRKGMPDSDIHWVANEGVRVSFICTDLSSAKVKPDSQAVLQNLLSTFNEDFNRLPAVQSQKEVGPMSTQLPGLGGMVVTVNGTANFYVGVPTPGVAIPSLALPADTAPAIVTAVEKKLQFDPDYDKRPGYDRDFLGIRVNHPEVANSRLAQILKEQDKPVVLKYHHYSVVMNKSRRLQMWSAVNVDYTPSKRRKGRSDFGTDTWVADPRIPGKYQIEDQELYQPAAKFDRGHIVRREDTAWGDTAQEEVYANSDSFHWTNCTPQHEQFNRAEYGFHGFWGDLENHIKSQAKDTGNRMSIFAGPVLDDANDIDHDFGGGPVKIPRRFWKVVLAVEEADSAGAALRAFGFVLDQSEAIQKYGIERFSVGKFKTYQYRLEDLGNETAVTFDQSVLDADAMQGAPEESKRVLIESLDQIRI